MEMNSLCSLLLASWLVFGLWSNVATAEGKHCRYVRFATLPVQTSRVSPYIEGTINGVPMMVLVDTGSEETSLTRPLAERAHLVLAHTAVENYGLSGLSDRYRTLVDDVTFGPVHWRRANLPVVWQLAGDLHLDAILGANFLFRNDVEIVLSEEEIRFFRPEGCDDTFLAYWDENASFVPTISGGPNDARPMIKILINGKPFKALIDSGAMHSAIDIKAAESVGVTRPDNIGEDVKATVGVGTHVVQSWVGTFSKIEVGSESIKGAKVDVLDMWGSIKSDSPTRSTSEMLEDRFEVILGADFLRAHRVLFAVSQRRMYFSYLKRQIFLSGR